MVGLLVFKMHVLTYFLLVLTGMCIDILDHSGYVFPISPLHIYLPHNEILFGRSSHDHHETHHNQVLGNYGSISLIYDYLFSTSLTQEKTNNKINNDKDN